MPPTSVGRGHYKMMAVSVRLFVCRMLQSNMRTERPRKPKFGRMETHHTGNP